MAKLDIRSLNYITSGTKQNSFNIEYCYTNDGHIETEVPSAFSNIYTTTFFGDVGTNDSMNQRYATNKTALYDMNNNIIIHNLYKIERVKLQSASKKPITKKDRNLDFYLPTIHDDLLNCCQFDNYAFALSKEYQYSPVIKTIEFNTAAECSYHYVLSNDKFSTYLHYSIQDILSPVSDVSTFNDYVLEYPELSSQRLSTLFNIKRSLNTIGYNYFIQFPNSTIWNNYENGSIQCDFAVMKNPYNVKYSLNATSSYSVINARDYVGLDVCGGKLYARYRDNVNYNVYHSDPTSDIYQLSVIRSQPNDSYSYQHIEIINSFDRFDKREQESGHKSNMYSIRLTDTGFNNSELDENIKAKFRQTITNNIRTIAEKLCPVNTQLFNVYFEGL